MTTSEDSGRISLPPALGPQGLADGPSAPGGPGAVNPAAPEGVHARRPAEEMVTMPTENMVTTNGTDPDKMILSEHLADGERD